MSRTKGVKKSPKKKCTAGIPNEEKKSEKIDYSVLNKTIKEKTSHHGTSKRTAANYEGHIRRGREFLQKFIADEKLAQKMFRAGQESDHTGDGEQEAFGGDENVSMDPEFIDAFTGPPKKCTPMAISMFIGYKCFHENLSGTTASSIHAAFVWHYDYLKGSDGKYRGKWGYDDDQREARGNPCRSPVVEDVLDACLKKDGEGERKHSRAMSIEDMEKVYQYSLRQCPEGFKPKTQEEVELLGRHLFYRAFASFAFTIWTRNFETTSFRFSGLDFLANKRPTYTTNPVEQSQFFRVNLRERKNWQKKMKNGELQVNGHCYNIYPDSTNTTTPSTDLYKHLLNWLEFAKENLLGREWHPDDHVFFKFGKHAHPETGISPEAVGKMITEMATAAGVPHAELFTTHCFRRGGAQYRFMFAPIGKRWTLARIRWWGGWALGEKRDTLIRYLLDELYTYEEDHSDALNPANHDISASGSHAGEGYEDRPLTIAEGRQMIEQFTRCVAQHIDSALQKAVAPVALQANYPPWQAPSLPGINMSIGGYNQPLLPTSGLAASRGHLLPVPAPVPVPNHTPFFPAPFQISNTYSYPLSPPTFPNPCIPLSNHSSTHLPGINYPSAPESTHTMSTVTAEEVADADSVCRWRIPEIRRSAGANGWRQVVADWKYASPPRLAVALKDWQSEWYKKSGQSVLYGQRATIAREFIVTFNENEAEFLRWYPEANKNVTVLFRAIQARELQNGQRQHRAGRT